MIENFRKAIFLLIVLMVSISCKKNDEVLPTEPVPVDMTYEQASLISSENAFAFDIFGKIIGATDDDRNIIISPLSMAYALSMTLNGAEGDTRDSIMKALNINGLTTSNINSSFSDLTNALLSVDKRINMQIANSVWTENNFIVRKEFTDILATYYNTESKSFDIHDQSAPDKINQWIGNNTNGLIKNMIGKLDDNTVMLLINAIYFKGKWKSQFDIKNTVQSSFYPSQGNPPTVPMMKLTTDMKAISTDGFIVAELPYGQGNFVMDVILPDQNISDDLLAKEIGLKFPAWINSLRQVKVDLSMPRFRYQYKANLNDVLKSMGMGVAFTDAADFSGISQSADLLISNVTHQALIETNEEGSEAAAATVVEIGTTAAPLNKIVLNLNRPFIYIIREVTTNSILFMGRVANPVNQD